MKKIQISILLFSLILLFPTISAGDMSVSPAEITISMENKNLINGNTSTKITVTNSYYYTYNVTWYIEHPTPSSIRSNKTYIPDLSWITVEPKWLEIPSKGKGIFYIYLDIPETKENLNKSWETWITFKGVEQDFINLEYAIRVYINTPSSTSTPVAPTFFMAETYNETQIDLSWPKVLYGERVVIERNTFANWSPGEGISVCNVTGASFQDVDLDPGVMYFYQAWGYNVIDNRYSMSYATAFDTTTKFRPAEDRLNIPTLEIAIFLIIILILLVVIGIIFKPKKT